MNENKGFLISRLKKFHGVTSNSKEITCNEKKKNRIYTVVPFIPNAFVQPSLANVGNK